MCYIHISEQRTSFTLNIINLLGFYNQGAECFSAVRIESLCSTDYISPLKG